jgi:hypothetical protein
MDVRTKLKVVVVGVALSVALAAAGPLAAKAFALDLFEGTVPVSASSVMRDNTEFIEVPSGVDTSPVLPSAEGLAVSSATATDAPSLTPALVDAPYGYLWTPWHGQERSYWCGPASCQIVCDYFGNLKSQATMASFMGTTSSGTSITKVDDCLRNYTGRSYECFTGNSTSSLLSRVAHTIGTHRQPVVADVRINPGTWYAYRFAHAGHIIPVEAFDWRYGTVRVDDPYNEASWRSGGGPTGGHTTYPVWALANGIASHPQRAVVAAP